MVHPVLAHPAWLHTTSSSVCCCPSCSFPHHDAWCYASVCEILTEKDTSGHFHLSRMNLQPKGLVGKFPTDSFFWIGCKTTCSSWACLALHRYFHASECVLAQSQISWWSHLWCRMLAWKPFVETSKHPAEGDYLFSFDASFIRPALTHLWRRGPCGAGRYGALPSLQIQMLSLLRSLIRILLIRLFVLLFLLLLSVHLVSTDALLIVNHRKVDAQLCGVASFVFFVAAAD